MGLKGIAEEIERNGSYTRVYLYVFICSYIIDCQNSESEFFPNRKRYTIRAKGWFFLLNFVNQHHRGCFPVNISIDACIVFLLIASIYHKARTQLLHFLFSSWNSLIVWLYYSLVLWQTRFNQQFHPHNNFKKINPSTISLAKICNKRSSLCKNSIGQKVRSILI